MPMCGLLRCYSTFDCSPNILNGVLDFVKDEGHPGLTVFVPMLRQYVKSKLLNENVV